MSDLLRMDYINSLPQPFIALLCSGVRCPVEDIDVETGLIRIDVCGKLEIKHIGEVIEFVDVEGDTHDPDTFYSDYLDEQPCTDCGGSGVIFQTERQCSCGCSDDPFICIESDGS